MTNERFEVFIFTTMLLVVCGVMFLFGLGAFDKPKSEQYAEFQVEGISLEQVRLEHGKSDYNGYYNYLLEGK